MDERELRILALLEDNARLRMVNTDLRLENDALKEEARPRHNDNQM